MNEHFNGLSPRQAELLTLLAEECAEVIQAVTKIQRHGLHGSYDGGETNVAALERELGDARAASLLLQNASVVDFDRVAEHSMVKLARVRMFLHHINDPE